MQAGITRQEAVDSLRHTNGDMNQALDNELSSWHIDTPYLDQLVDDYANFRSEDYPDHPVCVGPMSNAAQAPVSGTQ